MIFICEKHTEVTTGQNVNVKAFPFFELELSVSVWKMYLPFWKASFRDRLLLSW